MEFENGNLHIQKAATKDFERLIQFREAQFETSDDLYLIEKSPLSEIKGEVYLLLDADAIASTIQQEEVSSYRILNQRFTHYTDLPFQDNWYPTFYLSKAGTRNEDRNKGYNYYFFIESIRAAMESNKIMSISGIVFDGAARTKHMRAMGFHFSPLNPKEQFLLDGERFFVEGKRQLALAWVVLERKDFEFALAYLENSIKALAKR